MTKIEPPHLTADLAVAHKDGKHGKLVFGCSLCAERAKPKDDQAELTLQVSTVMKLIYGLYDKGVDSDVQRLDDEFAKLLSMLKLGG